MGLIDDIELRVEKNCGWDPDEEIVLLEKLKRRIDKAELVMQRELRGVNDHLHITLQNAFFNCASECQKGMSEKEVLRECIKRCDEPLESAKHTVEHQLAKFREELENNLKDCRHKLVMSSVRGLGIPAMKKFEYCTFYAVYMHVNKFPHRVSKIGRSISMKEYPPPTMQQRLSKFLFKFI